MPRPAGFYTDRAGRPLPPGFYPQEVRNMTGFKRPDITPAQIVAVIGAIIGVLVAAGLDISQDLQDQIISLVTVLSTALIVGDGAIRVGRSQVAKAEINATAYAPPDGDDNDPSKGGPDPSSLPGD